MTPDAARGPDDPIAAIRARHERDASAKTDPLIDMMMSPAFDQAHADRATLLGALDAVQAERTSTFSATDQLVRALMAERDGFRAQLAAAEAALAAVGEALRGVMALIEEGWLVRNTKNDAHYPSFMAESVRLVTTLKAARDALERRDPAIHPGVP